jgi:hypothetical protein
METAPYVATLGAVLALLFAFDGAGERATTRDFGLGFAGVSALVFVATVPPSAWGAASATCDAFSSFQFVMAVLAGGGLALICSIDLLNGTMMRRTVSLGCLAAVLGAALIVLFPQCLAAPYGNLDPRLKELWLDHISEAQSLWQLIVEDKASVAARYVTPAVAIILMALRWRNGGWRRQDTLVAALLVAAFGVSVWQVRGSTFSIAFAVIPLSAWIGLWRERVQARPSRLTSLRMAAVWLVSVNASWMGVAAAASVAMDGGNEPPASAVSAAACEGRQQFLRLAAEPATTVLAVSNLGSPILAYSGHRVFAGPYHRNVAGNLLALDAFLDPAADARAIVMAHHVGIVALCRGSSETDLLAHKAPDGFLAGLAKGVVPDWLEPVADTRGQPLELYRVRAKS